ncbi:MAG: agmatinase [Thermoguttaceae bacterium]|nr:agmatinase [Thermoguttaceae bacterium]
MLPNNVETFIGCDATYADASIVLYGAPFDSTTSYRPGARFGSKAIRGESFGIEMYSPYQNRDLTDYAIFDSGDLELCFGSPESALNVIGERTRTILNDGKFPFLIGGEHLVTLGAVREVLPRYPNLHIIHFDAHADLRDDYFGAKLSHACVLRRCDELLRATEPASNSQATFRPRIHQFGIRSGIREEFEFAAKYTNMHRFDFAGLAETIESLGDAPVYLTLDLDVLDPSAFPGTGTPEAGGVSFLQLLSAIQTVRLANVVGCDVNELAPNLDASGASTALACKVVRELLLALAK